MKQIAKRGVSLLLVVVLLVSLLPGLPLAASAASYTYNWGYRGVTATELSSAAKNFYANNGTSYEEMSSYAGSAPLSSVPSSEMYKQLQTLMKSNHSYETSYAATRELYRYTDCEGGGGTISSFYSGTAIGPDWDSGSTWNREHTWPNSKGLGGNDENDIMMLRPTAKSENGSRGNDAYGISSGYYDPNMESGYTLNLHGDVARIFLYVYVRWGNVNGNGEYDTWGSRGVIESREVLLDWMKEDPVDTWELARNDVVQEITGTRNVFVDYPELAFLLFGEAVPGDMTTPSGMAIAGAYDITVSSNDTAMGTVSCSGKTIVAVPAEGYRAVGYEVVSGTAEVTQNGNVFEVKASSDCEIKILFEPKPIVDLTYLDNGQILSSSQVYDGDPITLPAYTGTASEGYSFLGWVDAPVSSTGTIPTYYKAGESYTVNGVTSLYALFSRTVPGAEGDSIVYTTSPCIHENTEELDEKAATCTDDGHAAGVYCTDCETFISGGETVPASGHSYSSVVTPPTVTDAGYTTHTCGNCGDIYTSDPVPALGETYTVSFSVPVDAEEIADMGCNTTGIILPEATALSGYSFRGWTTATVADTTEAPEILNAGEKYVATEHTTLYAVYAYTAGESDDTQYLLVTSADQLVVGKNIVITSASHNYALSTTQNSNNRGQAAITKNDDHTITFGEDTAVLVLGEGTVDGSYSFYCEANSGYLYASSSSKNYLRTKEALDAYGSFAITAINDGACEVYGQGGNTRNYLRYNSGSSLFACYAGGQTAVSFYIETAVGETYYTTEIAHRHSATHHPAVEATCTAAGNVEYWSCGCGQNFADSGCTQLLTSVVDPQKEHSFTVENVQEQYLKSAANCKDAAVYYLSCEGCGASSDSDTAVFSSGEKKSENHVGDVLPGGAIDATCTTDGQTDELTCSGCGTVLTPSEVIPATGHADATEVAEEASTCKTNGVAFHYHCDACGGDYLEKTVSAVAQTAEDLKLPLDEDNHEGGTELKNATDATCEKEGYTGDTCCVGCGEVLASGEAIGTLSHTNVWVDNGDGTHNYACDLCGAVEIENQDHTYTDGKCDCGAEFPAEAVIDGVQYETLAEALFAAQAGDVVTLLKDVTIDSHLIIPNGVTLDLADATLTANYIFASKDSCVTANPDSGKLMVPQGNVLLGKNGYINADGQYVLPIWDPAEGCYVFSLFIVDTDVTKGRGLKIDEEAEQIYFQFKHRATKAINQRLLVDGAADNELSVIIRLAWTNEKGTAYQDFVYNDSQIGKVAGSYDYTFTLNGFSALGIELSTLTVTAMVVTNSGATAFGTEWTQATAN